MRYLVPVRHLVPRGSRFSGGSCRRAAATGMVGSLPAPRRRVVARLGLRWHRSAASARLDGRRSGLGAQRRFGAAGIDQGMRRTPIALSRIVAPHRPLLVLRTTRRWCTRAFRDGGPSWALRCGSASILDAVFGTRRCSRKRMASLALQSHACARARHLQSSPSELDKPAGGRGPHASLAHDDDVRRAVSWYSRRLQPLALRCNAMGLSCKLLSTGLLRALRPPARKPKTRNMPTRARCWRTHNATWPTAAQTSHPGCTRPARPPRTLRNWSPTADAHLYFTLRSLHWHTKASLVARYTRVR